MNHLHRDLSIMNFATIAIKNYRTAAVRFAIE